MKYIRKRQEPPEFKNWKEQANQVKSFLLSTKLVAIPYLNSLNFLVKKKRSLKTWKRQN